jgi:hypothetical protein
MSIYNIDFHHQIIEALPVNKRLTKWANWLFVLTYPITWLKNVTYGVFKSSYNPSTWSAGTYNNGDVVEYLFKTYISLIDGNTDVPTTSNWELISNNWRGVDERVYFTANKGTFEYALNLFFRGVWTDITTKDIYIENNVIESGFFRVGLSTTEAQSTFVGLTLSSEPIAEDPENYGEQASYTIFVKESIFNGLGSTDTERENTVRSFADRYNIAGLFYSVEKY